MKRFIQIGGLGVVVLASGLVGRALSQQEPGVPEELRARRFVVVADSGEEIGEFGINENGVAVMGIKGPGESGRVGVAISDGVPSLYVKGAGGNPSLTAVSQADGTLTVMVLDQQGELAATYSSFAGGKQLLHLHTPDDASRGIVLGTEANGDSKLLLVDKPGATQVELGVSGTRGGQTRVTHEGAVVFDAP